MPKQKDFTLTPEQSQKVEEFMPYADTISLLFRNRPADFDDICHEAYLGLCIAVTMYAGKNNATFETFASKYIFGRIQRFIKHYSHTQILSLDEDDEDDCSVETTHASSPSDICCFDTQVVTTTSFSKHDDDEGNLSLEETLPDPDSMSHETQLNYKLLVERLISAIDESEREKVKCAFYIDHKSQIRLRIWQRFNLSKPRFYAIVNHSILKMAEYAFINHIESPFKN